MRRALEWTIGVAGVLLLIAAPSGCEEDAGTCRINSDCAADQICRDGSCVVECRETRDCASGFVCSAGRCEELISGRCTTDRDCRNGEACVAGVCELEGDATAQDQDSAESDTRVPEDTQAQDTQAQDTQAQDTQPQDTQAQDTQPQDTQAQDTQPQDTQPQDTQPQDTQPQDTGSDCEPASRGYREPCECKEQCASGYCLGDTDLGVGFCTRVCSARSDCDGGADACIESPDGQGGTVSVCIPDDTGSVCTAVTDCFLQTCIQEPTREGAYCSSPCTTSSDCASGHTCSITYCRTLNAGFECVPVMLPYYTCSNPEAGCAEREQLLTQYDMLRGQCIPTGTTCSGVPPGDTNISDQCSSGLCDSTTSGNLCTSTCTVNAECPFGRPCVAISTTDSRLPMGFCDL